MVKHSEMHVLFGADVGWVAADWTASDDRVRGGSSQSYLDCYPNIALFHGQLDIETLGGAGFASQRTTGTYRHWDLSAFDGIVLTLDESRSDHKRYTLILKDQLPLASSKEGQDRSTLSWEADFNVAPTISRTRRIDCAATIYIPWNSFRPTYRGKEQNHVPRINLKDIRQINVMMRSYFGSQEGAFRLGVISICAANFDDIASKLSPVTDLSEKAKRREINQNSSRSSWRQILTCCLNL